MIKFKFKFLCSTLSLVMLSCMPLYFTSCYQKTISENYVDIVFFNDFHGSVEGNDSSMAGIIRFANEYNEIKKKNELATNNSESTVLVSGGDIFQGSAFSNLTSGESVAELFKSLGLLCSALGNHEFDWGLGFLDGSNPDGNTFSKWGDFKFLACNIYKKDENGNSNDRVDWALPYLIHDFGNDFNVAFVGVSSENTPETTSNVDVKEKLVFKDPSQEIEKTIDEINSKEENKPEAIIVIAHEGDEKADEDGTISDIVKKTSGVDAYISAHSHVLYDKKIKDKSGKEVDILQAGKNGNYLGELKLNYDPNKKDGQKMTSIETQLPKKIDLSLAIDEIINTADKNLQQTIEIFNYWEEKLDKKTKEEVCNSEYEYKIESEDECMLTEQGYLYCISVLEQLKQEMSDPVIEPDFVIFNYGCLRTDINKGKITIGDMYNIAPFDNYVTIVQMKPKDILEVFNQVYNKNENKSYGCTQYAGFKIHYNKETKIFDQIYDLDNNNITNNDTQYNVATNDFFSGGGDNAVWFKENKEKITQYPEFIVRDLLIEFFKSETKPLENENYKPDNRINYWIN